MTDRDICIRKYDWDYAFNYRASDRKVALLSSYRINYDYVSIGHKRVAAEVQNSRLRKMITKNIGALYFSLPLSNNSKNVMYGNVGSPQELDQMGDDFLKNKASMRRRVSLTFPLCRIQSIFVVGQAPSRR